MWPASTTIRATIAGVAVAVTGNTNTDAAGRIPNIAGTGAFADTKVRIPSNATPGPKTIEVTVGSQNVLRHGNDYGARYHHHAK